LTNNIVSAIIVFSTCLGGVMVATLVLGTSGEIRVGSSPT
jgi:hypothetical protein